MKTNEKKGNAFTAFLLLCSLGAALTVVLSAASYGPGITHDSAAYMYAAQSLLNREGFQYFGYPSPFIQWPPLYPILLALGGMAGLSSGTCSILVNSLAFAMIVFFAGRWMRERFADQVLAAGGTLLLAVSVPLLQVSKYMWTEILFLLFFLLSFLFLERFKQYGKYGALLLAAVFSALACVDRYAGVTIVAVGCLFLLFSKKGFWRGVLDAALYGAVSSVPMGIWVIRNVIVSQTLLGVRLPSEYPLLLNIKRSLKSIYTWFQPDNLLAGQISPSLMTVLRMFSILIPALIAAGFIVYLALRLFRFASSRKLPAGVNFFPIVFFAVFSIVYTVYLIASATSVAFEPINSRYLIPIYLPVVLGILSAADILLGRLGRSGAKAGETGAAKSEYGPRLRVFRVVTILLMLLYLVYPFANTAATVLSSWRNGAGGYVDAGWREKSGFLKFMDKDGQTAYFSNNADVVYVMSGIRTYSPPKKSGPYMYGLEQFKTSVARSPEAVLIWFGNAVPKTLYNLEELSGMYGMQEIGDFGYGKVYRIAK